MASFFACFVSPKTREIPDDLLSMARQRSAEVETQAAVLVAYMRDLHQHEQAVEIWSLPCPPSTRVACKCRK